MVLFQFQCTFFIVSILNSLKLNDHCFLEIIRKKRLIGINSMIIKESLLKASFLLILLAA